MIDWWMKTVSVKPLPTLEWEVKRCSGHRNEDVRLDN